MLEMAQGFGKHGVMFIPVPVLCEEDMRALTAMLETNLKKLEEYADEPTKPADNNHAD